MIDSALSYIGALTVGLSISVGLGHLVTSSVVANLRTRGEIKPGRFTWLLGCLERMVFTLAWVAGYRAFIAFWLGLKMVSRWDPTHNVNSDSSYKAGTINVLLIGNLLSLMFAVLGGIVASILLRSAGHQGVFRAWLS